MKDEDKSMVLIPMEINLLNETLKQVNATLIRINDTLMAFL